MDKDNTRARLGSGDRAPRPELPLEEGCGCEREARGDIAPDQMPDQSPDSTPNCPPYQGTTCPCEGYEGCPKGSWGLCHHPLGMVYAPCQYFCGLYDPATALSRGTLFEALDLPLEVAPGASCPLDRRPLGRKL